MKLNEQEQARAKDFQALKNMNAWQRLETELEEQKRISGNSVDTIAIDNFTLVTLAEQRGYRKGLQFVIDTVNRRAEIG